MRKQPCPPHHFKIASPNGSPLTKARCLKCGERRTYRASLESERGYIEGWRSLKKQQRRKAVEASK